MLPDRDRKGVGAFSGTSDALLSTPGSPFSKVIHIPSGAGPGPANLTHRKFWCIVKTLQRAPIKYKHHTCQHENRPMRQDILPVAHAPSLRIFAAQPSSFHPDLR
jgi:hypothetical protein